MGLKAIPPVRDFLVFYEGKAGDDGEKGGRGGRGGEGGQCGWNGTIVIEKANCQAHQSGINASNFGGKNPARQDGKAGKGGLGGKPGQAAGDVVMRDRMYSGQYGIFYGFDRNEKFELRQYDAGRDFERPYCWY